MDLSRVKDEEKLNLSRKYFYAGFALLPFLWFVNAIWFFREAFRRPPYDQQQAIKGYVIKSMVGSAIWFILIVAWIIVFQTMRTEWGDLGDDLSFVVPKGRP